MKKNQLIKAMPFMKNPVDEAPKIVTMASVTKENVSLSAKEIILLILEPRQVDPIDMHDELVRIVNLRQKIFSLFHTLCRPLGINLQKPQFQDGIDESDLRNANELFAEQIVMQMKYDRIGRLDIVGPELVHYTFYEDIEERDDSPRVLFHVPKKRVKSRHIVMNAKVTSLTRAVVKLNKRAKWFVSHILSEPLLAPHFGIVTGLLVETEEEIIKRWREETELKKALDAIRTVCGHEVAKREKEMETENNSVRKLVRKYMRRPDPALIFGCDIVLYGWV